MEADATGRVEEARDDLPRVGDRRRRADVVADDASQKDSVERRTKRGKHTEVSSEEDGEEPAAKEDHHVSVPAPVHDVREGKEQEAMEEKRQQEETRKYREYLRRIKLGYKLRYPELLDLSEWGFAPTFAAMFDPKTGDIREENLIPAGDGIYLMEVFTAEFCQKLTQEVDHFEAWCDKEAINVLRPNSMNNYGMILDHIQGMDAVLQQFIAQLIEPLSRRLFPHLHPKRNGRTSSLDSHHGFIVEYGADKDKKLDWHVDESEVTLNVCLGKDFTGGDLVFSGVRCKKHRRDTPPLVSKGENIRVAHIVGHGLLHVGKHRHAALPIESGERTNLILWCNNSSVQEGTDSCPSWCGWHKMESSVS